MIDRLRKISTGFNESKTDIFKQNHHLFTKIIEKINDNDNNILSLEEERAYFKSLHFIKYRISSLKGESDDIVSLERDLNKIRTRIVNANNGLIYKVSSKIGMINKDDEELYSEGLLALLNATDRYDPWRGHRFSTYAYHAIRNQLVGLSKSEANHAKLDDVEVVDVFSYVPKEQLFETGILDAIERANLPDNEMDIISKRFGLGGVPTMTLKQLSKEYGKTVEAIRLAENRALDKIGRAFRLL